jgi:hypothetical protein
MPPAESRSMIPPGYWMHEQGTELKPAVKAYLTDPNSLTIRQIALLRAYLRQWIGSGVWDEQPSHDERSITALRVLRESVDRIVTTADLHAWLKRALDEGHDPL